MMEQLDNNTMNEDKAEVLDLNLLTAVGVKYEDLFADEEVNDWIMEKVKNGEAYLELDRKNLTITFREGDAKAPKKTDKILFYESKTATNKIKELVVKLTQVHNQEVLREARSSHNQAMMEELKEIAKHPERLN